MASSYLVGILSSIPDGLVSLGVGLWGVTLARWVFVNRENRRLPRKQPWQETLPLTLVAMLITGVLVLDREMGLSAAAFTGLGVGWSAVLLLDIFGERIQAVLRAGWSAPMSPRVKDWADLSGHGGQMQDADVEPTPAMRDALERLDEEPGQRRITDQRPDSDGPAKP